MKTAKHLTILVATLCGVLITIYAADKQGGPKGGRLLETSPKAEFLGEKDKTVSINFYDTALNPVAVADQSVTVIAEAKTGKRKLDFEKKGTSLVSKTKLPPGDGYNLVVQFKQTAEAKPQNFRFKYDENPCAKCNRAEYACICDE